MLNGRATAEDIAAFIARQPHLVAPLEAVSRLRLPDCWIAAGFVRNAVWDVLHCGSSDTIQGDVDVVYFDKSCATADADAVIEKMLCTAMLGLEWSVKNQARMHVRNGDPQYASTSDAMTHWPEICTAVAARSNCGVVELLAPFGVDDLTSLRVRPTPSFSFKLDIYRERVVRKRWSERWPRLTITFG